MYQFRKIKDYYDYQKHLAIEAWANKNWTPNVTDHNIKSGQVKLAIYTGVEVKLGDIPHHVFFYMHDVKSSYRAFCGGSIITERRVLSASHCFFTNRKRLRFKFSSMKAVAGSLMTRIELSTTKDANDVKQWRNVVKVYTQMYFRYPAYNLAVVEIDENWQFNKNIAKIPYATRNNDYDGICEAIGVRPATSWALNKQLCKETVKMIKRASCETTLQRTCRLYYCTEFDQGVGLDETDGAGLICRGTGDPAEIDPKVGVLVGVTSLVNIKLPTLHNRVGIFNKWVTDGACSISQKTLFFSMFILFGLSNKYS